MGRAEVSNADFLRDGGEMGACMRRFPWHETPLGEPAGWPQSLKTAVSLMLRARQPMCIGWGPQHISLYNDGYIPICGAKHPQALGRPMAQVWSEIWDQLSVLNDAVMRGEAQFYENRAFALDGGSERALRYFSFSYTPLLDDSGAIGGFFCSAVETTAAMCLAQSHADEMQRLQRMFEQAPGFIAILGGPLHVYEFVNDTHRRAFPRGDIIGKTVREAFPDIKNQGFFEWLDEVYRTGVQHVAHGMRTRLRDAADAPEREVVLDFVFAPMFDAAGRVTGIFCEGQDVTRAEAAQQAMRETQARLEVRESELRSLADNSPDLIARFDPQLRHVFVNAAVERVTGIASQQFLGRTNEELGMPTALCEQWNHVFRRVFEEGVPLSMQFEVEQEGGQRHYSSRLVPEPAADGTVGHVLAVTRDITDLWEAQEALRRADRQKDDFLGTLAHELRNPLAPLRTGLHVLQRGSSTPKEQRVCKIMERQLDHMMHLVDDLLDIARISQGKIVLTRETLPLQSVLEHAVDACRPLLDAQGHTLMWQGVDRQWHVHGDLTRLVQVVSNLLNNAAKYTPAGGHVSLRAVEDGEGLAVIVEDDGIGIPKDVLGRLFDRFVQVDQHLERAQGGLGIGLSVVKSLVEMHGGRVSCGECRAGHG